MPKRNAMVKSFSLVILVIFFSFLGNAQVQLLDSLFQPQKIEALMEKVADWQLKEWAISGVKFSKTNWTNAACYTGLQVLSTISKNDSYEHILLKFGNDVNWNVGARHFHADDYCVGQTYSLLYMKYKDEKMITQFKLVADTIVLQPHTESLEWVPGIVDREWAWCDALFMAPTALSYLSTATGDKKYLDIATKLWWKTTDYLYDSSAYLYSRDGSYLNKKEKNGEKVFWSRGNGWVLAGLVRVLDNMPKHYKDRKRFISLYKDMSAKIVSLQQPDGTWHASLLDAASYPIKETSGTGFYAYALMWGINHNILDKKIYLPVVLKSWKALVDCVQPNGMLGYVQPIGAAPDKVDQNSTAVYGVGAFLLAGTELYRYLNKGK